MDRSSLRSSLGSSFDSSFSLFEVRGHENKAERVATLLTTLRILKTMRMFEVEKERHEVRHGKRAPPPRDSVDDVGSKNAQSIQFTADMFYTTNSQACLHVLHLLFECYDSKEVRMKFRSLWPIHEKKMETPFRRVTVHWLREIVEKFPNFFPGIKVEAIGGHLVNSGSDRFMQVMEAFSTLVLFLKALDKQREGGARTSDEGCVAVFEKPNYTNDPEIASRQIVVLHKTTQNLTNDTRDMMLDVGKASYEVQSRLQELKGRKAKTLDERQRMAETVNAAVTRHSSNSKGYSGSEYYSQKLSPVLGRHAKTLAEAIDVVVSPLVERTLLANSQCKILADFLHRFKSFWYIVRMDRTKNRVLDGNKLFMVNPPPNPTFRDFLTSVDTVVTELVHNKRLNSPLLDAILHTFAAADMRLEYLKFIYKDIELKRRQYCDTLNIEWEIEYLKKRQKGTDWRRVSGMYDLIPLSESLFSPRTIQVPNSHSVEDIVPVLLHFLDRPHNRAKL